MIVKDNVIVINFPKEDRELYVKKILEYMHYTDSLYYYIYFDEGFGNVDIYKYAEMYAEIYQGKGFIKLKDADTKNYHLIADFLYEYHSAKLYITTNPDADKKHDYKAMRDYDFAFAEYTVIDLEEEGIVIGKDWDMPAWDLEKMGIPEELVIKDNPPSEKVSLSNEVFSSIKSLFSRLKK